MSSHNVRADGSALSRADRALHRIEAFLTTIGGLAVLLAMLISVANILGRKLFNMPVPGYVAIMQQLVPLMAFLGIAFCQRLGGHIRMDIIVQRLHGRPLWLFELVGILLMAVLTVALIYGSWDHAERALRLGDTTDDLQIPTWPVKMVVPVMLTTLLARLALQTWGYLAALVSGASEPVAVPLPEDPAQQALHEAETVSGREEEEVRA
ncbi:MAG: TRAP transporter small permease [Alphaproteobacteria bacterium]|nr:MAG: TRAP transporter small permease [Alphaproteobacteria bacterium]